MSGGGAGYGINTVTGSELVQFIPPRPLGGPASDVSLFTTTAKIAALAGSSPAAGALVINIAAPPYNAIPDGQKAILQVTVAEFSNVLTVSLLPAWIPGNAYSIGNCVTNNGRSYTCVKAGTSGSPGPQSDTGIGNPIIDGSAWWLYLGPAAVSANIFDADTDVGKIVGLQRQDCYFGNHPWWTYNNVGPDPGHATITKVLSPSSIQTNLSGVGPPLAFPLGPAQTWPYNGTPAIIAWGTDNAAGIQAAFNAANAAGGGYVYVPAGYFCYGTQLIWYSNTAFGGTGISSRLIPTGVNLPAGANNPGPPTALANQAYLTVPYVPNYPAYYAPNAAPGLVAQYGDQNFVMENLLWDMDISGYSFGNTGPRFWLCQNVRIRHVTMTGSPLNPFDAINFTSCYDCDVFDAEYVNTDAPYNPWGGSGQMSLRNSRMVIPYNAQTPSGAVNGQFTGPQINICGTQTGSNSPFIEAEIEISDTYLVEHNIVYINGAANQTFKAIGIMYFPDGPGSSIGRNIYIRNNQVIACPFTHNSQGVLSAGGILNGQFTDNVIINCDGAGSPPFYIYGLGANGYFTQGNPTTIQPTSGSVLATVNWPDHNYTGTFNDVLPAFLFIENGPTISGSGTLGGYYEITSVPNGNQFVVNLYQTASTNVAVGWTASFAQILVNPSGIRVSGNKCVDCVSLAQLNFSPQTSPFTSGNVVTGLSSGATATIVSVGAPVYNSASLLFSGVMTLSNITGAFAISEGVVDTGGGSATVTAYSAQQSLFFGLGQDFEFTANESILSNYGTTGTYQSLVYFSGMNGVAGSTVRSAVMSNNFGPPGVGSSDTSITGINGTNRITWLKFYQEPIIIDTDDYNHVINVSPLNQTTIKTKAGVPAALIWQGNANTALPPNGFGGALTNNQSGGKGEIDLINTNINAPTTMNIVQMTSASTSVVVASFTTGYTEITGLSVIPPITGITASGTSQTTSPTVSVAYNIVTSGVGGVQLAQSNVTNPTGFFQTVFNGSTGSITVYPPFNYQLDNAAANVGFTLSQSASVTYVATETSRFRTVAIGGIAAGTLTSLTAGQGIAGGTITTTGTIYLSASTVISASANQGSFGVTGVNTSLAVVPAGTGSFTLVVADSAQQGGNARGNSAVDLQPTFGRNVPASVASGAASFVVGYGNTASNTASVAVGYQNSVSGLYAFAAGISNTSSGTASIAIGSGNIASGLYGVAFGASNTASAYGSISYGLFNTASSTASVAGGQYNTASGLAAIALGASNLASGPTTIALGIGNTASSTSSVAIGSGNNASGTYSVAIGIGNVGSNTASVAIGENNTSTGLYSFAAGGYNNPSGYGSIGLGLFNTSSATASVALGQYNTASALGSVAAGASNLSSASYSVALGNANTVAGQGSAVIGQSGSDRATYGKEVFSSGNIAAVGDAQGARHILRGSTSNGTTAVRLTADGGAVGAANSIPLPLSSSYSFWGYMVSNQGGTASKYWNFSGLIRQGTASATTTLVGSTASSAFGDGGVSGNTLTLAADTTFGAISFSVTGTTATTQHHVATVFTSEVI